MSTIYVLRGLPASGKSTWAKKFLETNVNVVRWNNDEFREMAYGKRWGGGPEKFVVAGRDTFIKDALGADFDVIVDNTNLNPVHLDNIKKKFDYRAAIVVKDFLATPDECVERDAKRRHSVGEFVIKDMAAKWSWPPTFYELVAED